MQTIYPGADWRPLGAQTEPKIGVPRVFIIHTMVGLLGGTDLMFRHGGYTGTESTFGVGGLWDGSILDGEVWQWQSIDHQADAQYDGNFYATSVETSDGGHPDTPWSSKQLDAIINLGVWWCRQTGRPPRLVKASSEVGFGYHRQFVEWNRSGHSCPGDVRLGQYLVEVIPEIANRVMAKPAPKPSPVAPAFPLPAGSYFGPRVPLSNHQSVSGYYSHSGDLLHWQRRMRDRGWSIRLTGHYDDSNTESVAREFQKQKGLHADGLVGPRTWTTAWTAPIT